ncbi:MAG: restriction endonuclease [Chloroflexota bacterium]|nr:restriction endonuclease [Chloroflexota bacterium]
MAEKRYENIIFKVPQESEDYQECSEFVVQAVESIVKKAMDEDRNRIIINTNLKLGIPMENVNKIAGPFIEAWAYEIFSEVLEDEDNKYQLVNVEAGERLNMADLILQFKRKRKRQSSVTGNVDVKATSQDIKNSGKSPNITSFARIRTAYVKDPDFIFIILSIKHQVYSQKDKETKMMMGVMEIVDFNAYDIKYISKSDLSYNPALGSGQIQIRDIHYVSQEVRTVWEFCQLLDRKCIASRKGFEGWYRYATQHDWIKEDIYNL